jgi:DNA-binding XRE family transcriptional regulator
VGRKKTHALGKKRGDKSAPDLKDRQEAFFAAFSRNVAARREARGMNQVELAYRTGLTRNLIVQLEGGRRTCNLFAAHLIAKALGTTLDKLCRES